MTVSPVVNFGAVGAAPVAQLGAPAPVAQLGAPAPAPAPAGVAPAPLGVVATTPSAAPQTGAAFRKVQFTESEKTILIGIAAMLAPVSGDAKTDQLAVGALVQKFTDMEYVVGSILDGTGTFKDSNASSYLTFLSTVTLVPTQKKPNLSHVKLGFFGSSFPNGGSTPVYGPSVSNAGLVDSAKPTEGPAYALAVKAQGILSAAAAAGTWTVRGPNGEGGTPVRVTRVNDVKTENGVGPDGKYPHYVRIVDIEPATTEDVVKALQGRGLTVIGA